MVVDELVRSRGFAEMDEEDRLVSFAAALLHDVSNPEAWVIEDGRITNKGHSRMGANEARQILWRDGWSFEARERVCAIIAVHQVPFWLIGRETSIPDPGNGVGRSRNPSAKADGHSREPRLGVSTSKTG